MQDSIFLSPLLEGVTVLTSDDGYLCVLEEEHRLTVVATDRTEPRLPGSPLPPPLLSRLIFSAETWYADAS